MYLNKSSFTSHSNPTCQTMGPPAARQTDENCSFQNGSAKTKFFLSPRGSLPARCTLDDLKFSVHHGRAFTTAFITESRTILPSQVLVHHGSLHDPSIPRPTPLRKLIRRCPGLRGRKRCCTAAADCGTTRVPDAGAGRTAVRCGPTPDPPSCGATASGRSSRSGCTPVPALRPRAGAAAFRAVELKP